MQVDICLFHGFEELDLAGPFEVLTVAAKLGAKFQVRLVAPVGAAEVVGVHGLRVMAEAGLREEPRPELVVVPGGGWNDRAEKGAWAEAARGEIPKWLAELYQAGTTIAAVCTGTLLVAAAGLLRGRPAITHHGAIADLRAAARKWLRPAPLTMGKL